MFEEPQGEGGGVDGGGRKTKVRKEGSLFIALFNPEENCISTIFSFRVLMHDTLNTSNKIERVHRVYEHSGCRSGVRRLSLPAPKRKMLTAHTTAFTVPPHTLVHGSSQTITVTHKTQAGGLFIK